MEGDSRNAIIIERDDFSKEIERVVSSRIAELLSYAEYVEETCQM